MTDTSKQLLPMPTTLDLVIETVEDFAVRPSRSSMLELDRQTLIDLGLSLVDPQKDDLEGFKELEADLGPGVVTRSSYYRYVPEFRQRFGRIRSAHRLRIARWNVGEQIGNADLREVIQAHMTRLVAERVVDADDLAKLEGKELSTIIAMLDGWTRAELKREEIDLKVADSERKNQKLEADLRKAELELTQLQQRVNEAKAKYDAAMQAQQSKRSDGRLTAEDIAEAKKAIFGEAA